MMPIYFPLKLNLGCGNDLKEGYVNVDKYAPSPEALKKIEGSMSTFFLSFDLESKIQVIASNGLQLEEHPEYAEWPWDVSTVDEVVMHHSLEHMGSTAEGFFHIMKELWRVCKAGAMIHINVPHPHHDDFINDPTHVRVITPNIMALFSKLNCDQWKKEGRPNTQLAYHLGVDFNMEGSQQVVEEEYHGLPDNEIMKAIKRYNNVIKEYRIQLKVNK